MSAVAQKSPQKSPAPFHKRFAKLLREFADEVEETGMGAPGDEWVDQYHSPLGPTKHLKLARTGVLKASKTDRKRVLIRRSDINQYIEAHPVKVRASAQGAYTPPLPPPENLITSDPDELEAAVCRRLGVVQKPRA